MPKKLAKRGSAKKPDAVNKNWESALNTAPFQEKSWQACVSLVLGRSPEDEELIRALSLAVQQPLRKLFSVLSWDGTLAKIHELGNPKAKKSDLPTFYEVTEPAKALLDAGEEIPCDLMAKILKFQLLQIKASDKLRREAEQAEEERAKAGPLSAGKDKGRAKVSAEKEKSPLSPSAKEKKTKLKCRDDVEPPRFIDDEPEDGPQHYILLLGFYQPPLIGALDDVGVHVANVINLYSEQQGVHSCESREQSLTAPPGTDAAEDRGDPFWSGLRAGLDGRPPESKLHDVVLLNYTVPDLSSFNTQDPDAKLDMGSHIFEGVAELIYDCLDWRRQHQHYLDNINLISIPTVVGLEPQHAEVVPTSVAERKLVRDSPSNRENEPPPLSSVVDMRYYTNLLDLVPPEACSVPLILHCMLEQVVISTESFPSPPSHDVAQELKPHHGPVLDHQLISFMLQTFLPLARTEEERRHMINSLMTTAQNEEDMKRLVDKFGVEENQKKSERPLVIRHHNERALRLRYIKAAQGFDPADVELSMMRLSPVWKLIHSGVQQRHSNSSWMSIKQQLRHFCADDVVPWLEVERLFHQSVFESMPLTRPDQEGILLNASGPLEPAQQQAPTIIPWDNPLLYAKQHLNNNLQTEGRPFLTDHPGNMQQISGRVCSQLELSDVQSCRLRALFDWHYTEHHEASVFPQVLQSASEEYLCLDTFRGSYNNILYIFCHNPMSPYRQCKEFWDVALHTDVRFRKYLEHVAETISDWTKEEESKREAVQLRDLSPPESLKDEKAAASTEEEDTLEPVIRKDSLKAWKLEQERLKEEEMSKKSKRENTPKGMQQKEGAKPADGKKRNTLSSGKKSRAETASSSAKPLTESITATAPPEAENREVHPTDEAISVRRFTGYSTDGKLIHVSGRLQYFFPSDGGQITVENVRYTEGSSLMKVAVKKDGHHFYTHINKVEVDGTQPHPQPQDKETQREDFKVSDPVMEKRVKQGSLTARLHNGIHLSYSFYGPTGEHIGNPQKTVSSRSKGTDLTHNHTRLSEPQPAFNSLSLSVPNGLLLQFLREDTQGVSSEDQGVLVKQSFPLHGRGVPGQLLDPSLSKELSRIVTSQGAVIRSMRDGSTEVLFADGSVSVSPDSGPVWVADSEVEEESTTKESDNLKENISQKEANGQRGCWLTTTPCGKRIHTVGTTHKHIPTTPLLLYEATDPITHQVMLSREDLVVSVHNPDGFLIVEHADGTRISSFYQDRPANTLQHMGEQPESATVESTSECACGSPECVCVTRCMDSIDNNMHIRDTCDEGEEIRTDSAWKARDKEDDGHDCDNVSGERESSVCKNDEESVSTKERVTLVEKEGCATVVMYAERHTAHILTADGTVITGNNRGAYEVFPSNVGLLQIQSDGKSVYSSDPLLTPSPKGSTPANQPGSFTMSHSQNVACGITDVDGNRYEVMEDGQLSVLSVSPTPSSLKEDEEDEEEPEEEADREMDKMNIKHRERCPRLFLVHEDGSGTELLSSQTVDELLCQAYADPNIALLKEPLPDTQDDLGITILKPAHHSVWSQWLLRKQNPDITPPNLRNRDWHDFPRTEVQKKNTGPPFGTNVGQGLTLSDRSGSTAQRQPLRSCPKVLEIRELQQHRPITTLLRNNVDTRLKEFMESLMEREQRSEEVKGQDPRSEEEKGHARDLLHLVPCFAEEEAAGHTFTRRSSEDIVSLYNQGVGEPLEQSGSEDTSPAASDSVPSGKESKWTERLAQHKQEVCEEQTQREALTKKEIVPYFHPENSSLYQNVLQHQTADFRSLSMDLPPIPQSDGAEAFLKEESTPRPLNPTPSQSASHAGGSGRKREKERPTNPTPQSAGESSLRGSSEHFKSVKVDVTGNPRRTKVRLPSSILSSKPCSAPNQQFLSVEEPVRRRCRTISLTDPNVIMRGFQLLPSSVDFGTLQEGTSSAVTVRMRNVGVDTCRFRVKQPPPSTGLRLIYNPGPVPAGLHVDLQVQLFALCAAQAGAAEPQTHITQDIIIHTEMDILYLPVTATILPQRLYDIWLKDQTSAHNKKGSRVRQLSSDLPGERSGRKDE